EPLVDPRVVLHRARAEWIEAGVDPEVARRERREVAQHLGLGQLGQARRRFAAVPLWELRHRQVGARGGEAAAPGVRLLVAPLTAPSASTRGSISATGRFSAPATSSASSRPG